MSSALAGLRRRFGGDSSVRGLLGGISTGVGLSNSESVTNLAALGAETDLLRRLETPLSAASVGGGDGAADDASAASAASATAAGTFSASGSAAAAAAAALASPAASPLPPLFDATLPLLRQGVAAFVDDSFTRCFKSQKRGPWNWNVYLAPAWLLGVVFRYTVLFPLRALALVLGFITIAVSLPLVKLAGTCFDMTRAELFLIQLLASSFVASWSGVIRIHGLRPTPRAGRLAGVFVANHSSMIDFIILLQSHPYAVVGQKHPGWVGLLQDHVLRPLRCIWFNREQAKDRRAVADLCRAHARDERKNGCPLLVFPEGTCVNNEYVVQFKKGVFELGVPINPIAIKYNKVFVDAYWNSREQSFLQHLLRLMTSWAVVVDVWFLDQQTIRAGESAEDFATRVQRLVAARAGIKAVDWDGYMKYWKPNARFLEERQRFVADEICAGLGVVNALPPPAAAPAGAAAPDAAAALAGAKAS